MGNRLLNANVPSSEENNRSHAVRWRTTRTVSRVKNKSLRQIQIRWRSPYPITADQLKRKRDEFWETAPAFDGRVEIWNALQAAVNFLEQDDLVMAQAIVDGAEIILPQDYGQQELLDCSRLDKGVNTAPGVWLTLLLVPCYTRPTNASPLPSRKSQFPLFGLLLPGTLCDCYDELGTRYQLPLYVLSKPSNLTVREDSSDNRGDLCPRVASGEDQPPVNSANIEQSGNPTEAMADTVMVNSSECGAGAGVTNPIVAAVSQTSLASVSFVAWLLSLLCCGYRHSPSSNSRSSWCPIRRAPNRAVGRGSTTKLDEADRATRLPDLTSAAATPCISGGTDSPRLASATPDGGGGDVAQPLGASLRLRLSTGEEHHLRLPSCSLNLTILDAKRLLAAETRWSENRQRWFVCGHLLPNRARLSDCRIPSGFLVQVVVHSPFEPESQWARTVSSSSS